MSEELWERVDRYLEERLIPSDPALEAALADSTAAELPNIQITATQGKWLQIIVQIMHARRVLEIGTLGGYSTIWMARGLPPEGKLITLEVEPKHAKVAQANFNRAGVAAKVELRLAPAIQSLSKLHAERCDPFDLIFIDADKETYRDYLEWSIKLAHPGTLIIADNVIREGKILDPDTDDTRVQGVHRFYDLLASDKRLTATALQVVGPKGYDGFAFALVT